MLRPKLSASFGWECRTLLSNFTVKLSPNGCHPGDLPEWQGGSRSQRFRYHLSTGVSQSDLPALALTPWVLGGSSSAEHFTLEGAQAAALAARWQQLGPASVEKDRETSRFCLWNLTYFWHFVLTSTLFKCSATSNLTLSVWVCNLYLIPIKFKRNPLEFFNVLLPGGYNDKKEHWP